ncbi:hypothetical protein BU14_0188s0009 [Porphyra umbilicalis]|uniref:Peptidase metallopeptidase domain-containing protein n=1 Tax=Porphyra umbilicalis TaxID=2786 RepID=A0A1X6P6G4_PORUM|nr:hypothetical protein BU14_0188s0009 [Porphyra umbilicalis]|eukprot:OSX76491.1 hypothetical protein BU14_0188s0009 [Porphyra umbilicalis]
MADGQQPPRRRRRPHGAIRFLAGAAAVAALTTAAPAAAAAAADLSPAERAGGRLGDGIVHTEAAVWDAAAAAGPSGVLSPDAAAWSAAYAAEVADAAAAAASAGFATAHPWWSAVTRLPGALQRWAAPPPADGAGGTALDGVAGRQSGGFDRTVTGTRSTFALALDPGMGASEANAVKAAARLWANEWPSATPVRVVVRWPSDPLPSLGAASTPVFRSGGADGTRDDTSYGAPLYLSLTGIDVVPVSVAHIDMRLNQRVRWHTDASRNAPSDRWDLTTVAAHELGHGLFFTGRIFGNASTSTALVLASRSVPEAARFDSFIADLDGNGVVASCSAGTRNDPSGLYNAVTARGLAFVANGSADGGPPTRLPLYAPKPYDTGSSVYHFDGPLLRDGCASSSIPADACSSLMEAALPPGKTARSLGDNTLRVMRVVREQALDGVDGGTCAVSPLSPGSTGGSGAGDVAGLFGGDGSLPQWAIIALGAAAAVGVVLLTSACFANVVLPRVQRRSRRRQQPADGRGRPPPPPPRASRRRRRWRLRRTPAHRQRRLRRTPPRRRRRRHRRRGAPSGSRHPRIGRSRRRRGAPARVAGLPGATPDRR